MLRMVRKRFDIDEGVTVQPGDIVDSSGWRNERVLLDNGFLCDTPETKVTVDPIAIKTERIQKKKAAEEATPPAAQTKKVKKSVLAGHKRVFTRKALQGV